MGLLKGREVSILFIIREEGKVLLLKPEDLIKYGEPPTHSAVLHRSLTCKPHFIKSNTPGKRSRSKVHETSFAKDAKSHECQNNWKILGVVSQY